MIVRGFIVASVAALSMNAFAGDGHKCMVGKKDETKKHKTQADCEKAKGKWETAADHAAHGDAAHGDAAHGDAAHGDAAHGEAPKK
jgi:hypothetical protein